MKIINLLFAIVFSVTIVLSQNTATTTQTGDKQIASTTQSGSLNSAEIDQLQSGTAANNPSFMNKATVIQTGNSNAASVDQKEVGGGNKGNNTAFIQQVGDNNNGVQYGNAANYNNGQSIKAVQLGDLNEVSQSIFAGYTESLTVNQTGNKNEAVQEARGGGNNHANINQFGNQNQAKQEVIGNNNGYSFADVLIEQDGDLNIAAQKFTGNGQSHKNNGGIFQNGSSNKAYQEGAGRDLDIRLWQNGELNVSNQYSTGNTNTSWLSQNGDENTSEIIQNGDDNFTKLKQNGTGGNVGILQEGNNNTIAGIDTPDSWGNVFNLETSQLGEFNNLFINSAGTVTVMQDNTAAAAMVGNEIIYSQSGVGITNLSQVGDENMISLLHGGNGNVDINQLGNSNKVGSFVDVFAADPVLNGDGIGGFNGQKLEVDQIGENNLLHINSTGYSDMVKVMQKGNNNRASVTQSAL